MHQQTPLVRCVKLRIIWINRLPSVICELSYKSCESIILRISKISNAKNTLVLISINTEKFKFFLRYKFKV